MPFTHHSPPLNSSRISSPRRAQRSHFRRPVDRTIVVVLCSSSTLAFAFKKHETATPYRRQEYRRVDSHVHSVASSTRGQSAESPLVPLQTLSPASAVVPSDLDGQANTDVPTQLLVESAHSNVIDRRKYPDTLVSQAAASESQSSISQTRGDPPGRVSERISR